MTDYALHNLSPRHFEHLVQSLAYAAISSVVAPFGDGPDGGREATFDDQTHYGPKSQYWAGFGVIQAKYQTRDNDTAKNAEWARAQLRKELQQYNRKDNPRRPPDYYIFAVNVVLSPGEGHGKDSVLKIMNDFAKKYNLKGVDLWDYDKLRVLLDNYPQIRKSYMAWITTSDVLAELCTHLRYSQRDFYPLILRYLQRELVSDQYAQLEQAGHSADEAIPLSQVFIDLATNPRSLTSEITDPHEQESPRFVETIIQDANQSYCKLEGMEADPAEYIRSTGRYMLIGGPGQGKTTVGQYVCQVFRSALLANVPTHLISLDARAALQGFIRKWATGDQSAPKARRLPFRIVLGDLAKSLAAGTTNSLMGYLAARFTANTDACISAEEIERILTEYPSIVVLDGLDEVPSSTNREAVMTAVSNFAIDVAAGNLDVMIIGTSRPQGYNQEFSPKQYMHHYLTPLNEQDALAYGNRLAETRFGLKTDRTRKVQERLQRAISNPATAHLMHSPLQVTILTLLVDRIGTPPEERWSLFNAYYRLIFERETERDIASVQVLKTHSVDVDAIHRRVGLALQVESERSGGTDARLTVEQFAEVVEGYLIEEGNQHPALEELKNRIIEAAANRLVFLVGLESGQVGFEIRSLQEFMAAQGLMEGPDEVIRERLTEIATSSHWRNTFLFAAGKCFAERRYLRDTVEAICFELNEDPDKSFRKLLVGSELALDLLEDGPARKQPTKRRSLTRLAVELLKRPFDEIGRLSAIIEDDTHDIYLEKLRDELLSPGELRANAAWSCLVLLTEIKGRAFEELIQEVLAEKPLNNAAFSSAIKLATGRNKWLSDVLFSFLEKEAVRIGTEGSGLWHSRNNEITGFGPWKLSDYPAWLEWYGDFSKARSIASRGTFNIRLIGSSRPLYSFTVNSVSPQAKNRALIPPPGDPNGDNWSTIRRAGEFCENPSPKTLANAVSAYTNRINANAGLPPIFDYPWPLAECLLACRPGQPQVHSVMTALDNEAFGDPAAWLEKEHQFTEEGITLDYLTRIEPVVVYEGEGVLYQFPFRSRRFSRPPSSIKDSVSDLVAAFDATSSSIVKMFLARILLSPIRAIGQPAVHPGEWLDRVLFSNTLLPGSVSLRFYEYLPYLDLQSTFWSDAFSSSPLTLFRHPLPKSIRYTGESLKILWGRASDTPEQMGLFVALAAVLHLYGGQELRSVLRPTQSSSSMPSAVRVAVLLINIAAAVSVRDLADDIRWALGQDRWLFVPIGRMILAREDRQMTERSELLSLIELMPGFDDEGWPLLKSNFLRKQSSLSEPGVWASLKLPSGILQILD